ncbi:MAG: hypothetical protein NTZ56_02885 [Acidobacteria bacterium]|nr:hypothetical protein [Acidobacteriota bacterium]
MISLALLTAVLCQNPVTNPGAPAAPSSSTETAADSRNVDGTKVTYVFGSILPKEKEWKPLTGNERWKIYVRQTWLNPGAVFRAAGAAAGDQASNRPREWGQGGQAYGQRVGSRFAVFTLQDSIQAGLASALKYDVRYLRCKCEGFGPRFAHALKQGIVTKNEKGHWVPNIPQWAGAAGGAAIGVYGWYPDSARNHNEVLRAGATSIVFPMAFNALVEFGPEIKRVFKRK